MSRTGFAHLPLHGGKAPRWLFERMVPLSREIVIFLAGEFGREEVLRRLSDPYWFQAFGCVLGFDWHSSGLTTTVCGALKVGLRGTENELGIFVAGGKGATSRKTPTEISATCESIGRDPEPLVYASRISAKVGNSAVQDGYQLYHHSFVFTAKGQWCIVQQGMSDATSMARRYHWLSDNVESYVSEPHAAICCDATAPTLNLIAKESADVRSPAPAACASAWQCRSAPSSPPRSAPFPMGVLVTKKLMLLCCACVTPTLPKAMRAHEATMQTWVVLFMSELLVVLS